MRGFQDFGGLSVLAESAQRTSSSNEHGGPVSTWNHRLSFEATSESGCRYTDEIGIEAGISTLPSVIFASLLFRWRQRRWRRLARLPA